MVLAPPDFIQLFVIVVIHDCRAAGTAPAGQAKTGPLVDQTTLVMVVNIKKLPTCSTVNIGGCGYKVGVVSKKFPRAYACIFSLTTSKLLPAALDCMCKVKHFQLCWQLICNMKITHKFYTDKIEVYQVAKEFIELNERGKNGPFLITVDGM